MIRNCSEQEPSLFLRTHVIQHSVLPGMASLQTQLQTMFFKMNPLFFLQFMAHQLIPSLGLEIPAVAFLDANIQFHF